MVEKETSLQKIQRLISNQHNIRNVATSAHIHHGKCISGDSRVMLSDGSIRLAKNIFEEVSKDGEIHEENEDHTVYIPKKKIKIFSLNKSLNSSSVFGNLIMLAFWPLCFPVL